MTLDAYTQKQIRYLTKKTSLQQSSPTTFAGIRGHRVLYRDNKGYDILEVWTIKENNLYIFRCIAKPPDFSNYLSNFQKMIDTFEIMQ
jgi:hypothetical protein